MEQINQILKKIGLTETETAVYLTGLNYDSISVNELEIRTTIKRTTIYHALDTLLQKGLVAKKNTGAKLAFTMTNPKNITQLINKEISQLNEHLLEFTKILPLLNQRSGRQEIKSKVSHYTGIDGIKIVVEEALYCQNRHWDIIAPNINFFSQFDKKYAQYYINTRQARGISARSLWEFNFERRALTPEEIRLRSPRFLPQSMQGQFKSVIIIFDDKVALISSIDELTAILIDSQEIHDTFAALFEGLWSGSHAYDTSKKTNPKTVRHHQK